MAGPLLEDIAAAESPPGEQLGEAYRRCCTSVSWVGEALAVHLVHGESVWNHKAFFDNVYRRTEDDTQAVAQIKSAVRLRLQRHFGTPETNGQLARRRSRATLVHRRHVERLPLVSYGIARNEECATSLPRSRLRWEEDWP